MELMAIEEGREKGREEGLQQGLQIARESVLAVLQVARPPQQSNRR
jgi:flagellar biosynthesis/type III secretory pathway protein FliH